MQMMALPYFQWSVRMQSEHKNGTSEKDIHINTHETYIMHVSQAPSKVSTE